MIAVRRVDLVLEGAERTEGAEGECWRTRRSEVMVGDVIKPIGSLPQDVKVCGSSWVVTCGGAAAGGGAHDIPTRNMHAHVCGSTARGTSDKHPKIPLSR